MAKVSKANGEMWAENKIEQNCTIEHKTEKKNGQINHYCMTKEP